MLSRLATPAAVVAAVAAVLLPGAAAANDLDPTPIDCDAQPWRVECRDRPAPPGDGGGERVCTHLGEVVPCNHPDYGWWLGDHVDPYNRVRLLPGVGEFISRPLTDFPLRGCWALRSINQPPPPDTGPEPDPDGGWYSLYCLMSHRYSELLSGALDTPQLAIGVWLNPGETPPDPETLARRAVAQIGLSAPEVRMSPPETGAVLYGMPVWLATAQTDATWGPLASGQVCELGLCVFITARATHIDWDMGDGGAPVRCLREQNTPWQPGMDFLRPGSACHHYYSEPSYDQPDGRYRITATTSFRVDWTGGGQSGVFENITDACGPAGTAACSATATVEVVELQLLTSR